ncbi:MAG: Pycsar system effector family protein [Terriglobia bacterium]|jgi:hypothetical protein
MRPETQYIAAKDQLSLVLGFFSRVESKLSFLFAIDTGVLAVLVADAPPIKDLSWSMIVAAALTLLLIGLSIVFLYRGAFPNLKGGEASLVYFREIASRTEHRFIEDFKNQSEEQHTNDLLGQAWRNSVILKMKFDSLKLAFGLLAAGIIPWLASLALFAANGKPARPTLLR